MLVTKKNTEFFEAVSKVGGVTVMTFRAEIDKTDPANSSIDVKKESESLYRTYRNIASFDRQEFEDAIFAMIDEYENPRMADEPKTIDGEYVNVKDIVAPEDVNHDFDEDIPNFTGDDDDQEYHGEWSSIPIPDSTRDEKIRQDCTEEEMTDGTYDCIMAGR